MEDHKKPNLSPTKPSELDHFLKQFTTDNELGEGAFGAVYKVFDKNGE